MPYESGQCGLAIEGMQRLRLWQRIGVCEAVHIVRVFFRCYNGGREKPHPIEHTAPT